MGSKNGAPETLTRSGSCATNNTDHHNNQDTNHGDKNLPEPNKGRLENAHRRTRKRTKQEHQFLEKKWGKIRNQLEDKTKLLQQKRKRPKARYKITSMRKQETEANTTESPH